MVKYRGSHHGTNEYPFLIDADGISVLPVSSLALQHPAPLERVSSGVARLDAMLSGKGYYRGSTILVSGTAGTGKTSLAAHFLDAACRRGERCLCFLFEESPQQLLRNMRSIGIDLEPWVAAGLLQFHADRPSRYGLETHLVTMHQVVASFRPTVAVIDPVTNLMTVGTYADVQAMLTRMIDHLKTENVTAMLTSLMPGQTEIERTETTISSLMDTWIVLANDDVGGRHRRGLYVLKSRGMAHSNELREFVLTDRGLDLHENGGRRARYRTAQDGTRRSPCNHLKRFAAPRSAGPDLPAAAVRCGTDAEVGLGVQEPEADLRGASVGPLRNRDHRSPAEPAARAAAIRFWPCPRSCAGCRNRSRRSSATCRIRSAFS